MAVQLLEASPEVLAALAAYGLDRLDRFWDDPRIEAAVFHRRPGGRSVARLELPAPAGTVYVKRWKRPRWGPLHTLFFGSFGRRLRREHDACLQLAGLGLAAPVPLAWGQERGWTGMRRACLVLQEVRAIPVVEHLARHPEDRGAAIECLARYFRKLHSHGLVYASPGAKHLWIRPGPSGLELVLIDLDSLEKSAAPRRLVVDHERLVITLEQELGADAKELDRFWCAYHGTERLSPEAEREIARVRQGATRRHERRTRRRPRRTEERP